MLLALLAIAYSGSYDIAASRGHTAGVRWFLGTAKRASVQARAEIPAGASGEQAADLADAGSAFKSMCEHCHGGPGAAPAAWSRGMLPRPPDLARAAREWNAGEIEWIIRHGLKYTGMPSFDDGHNDAALRDIAIFVTHLPAMTPAEYAALGNADDHHHDDDHANDAGGVHQRQVPADSQQHERSGDGHEH